MPMKLEQKLTVATLGWKRRNIEDAIANITDKDRLHLARIAGVAVGLKTAKDVNEEIIFGLKGNFRGVSMHPDMAGEMVSSGVCFLPAGIQGMLESALADARKNDANATIRFAVDVFATRATNKAGYTFHAENIFEEEAPDPVSALLSDANTASPLALPTPEKKGK